MPAKRTTSPTGTTGIAEQATSGGATFSPHGAILRTGPGRRRRPALAASPVARAVPAPPAMNQSPREAASHAPSKILVPVDFSASSRAALEYAALLGARLGAEVDVLHVWSPQHETDSKKELLRDFVRSGPGHTMMEWLASFELRGGVAAHGRLAPGAPGAVPDTIVEVVESGAYDLVVMATHGRHGLSLLWRSSVSEKVVRSAPCPVITVRAEDDDLPRDPGSDGLDVRDVWNVWS